MMMIYKDLGFFFCLIYHFFLSYFTLLYIASSMALDSSFMFFSFLISWFFSGFCIQVSIA